MAYLLEFLLSSDLCPSDHLTKDFTSSISVKTTGCVRLLLSGWGLGNAEVLFFNLVAAE